ncbi:MAG: S9 family peptidase [Chloroflexi bacterium]|nr:S9 family peptidase [Chloroflexota bacterium]
MAEKIFRPYGIWDSPISPTFMSVQLRLSDVLWDSDGQTLVWLEGRGAQGVLLSQSEGQAPVELNWEQNVRAGVGYGGGDFTVRDGVVVFAAQDGRLYRRCLTYDQPRAISPEFGHAASPALSPDGRWVVYVHSVERRDSLGLVACTGESWPVHLAQGADFYMQPVWHPRGDRLAWVEWDHPNMPWDGTRLMLAVLEGETPRLAQMHPVAGGADTPIFQPGFSPDGRWLSYTAGEGEWDKLYLLDLDSGQAHVLVDGGTLAAPAWGQGMHTYGWSGDSRRIVYLRNEAGFASLWQVEVESGMTTRMDLAPYTWLEQVSVSPKGDRVACIASSPGIAPQVITWEDHAIRTIRRSTSEVVDPQDLSIPRAITWKAPDSTVVHGLYFPPANPKYQSTGLPPAIVLIHGGPTSQRPASYSPEAEFFTSRGYAWLEVNYRGSTGYGRTYMKMLRGRWGELDVEDAAGGAQALVDQGLADAKRLVIKGGSAGGYTVLNALIRYPGKFKAGVCLYGVSNLFTLAAETHKFEERYTDSLVGPLPEAAEKYHAWSPIFHAEHIRDPLAVFQGNEDKVVPTNQAETIVAALREHHVPHIYRLYEGEGHGFRRPETWAAHYEDVLSFLKQYVLFSV